YFDSTGQYDQSLHKPYSEETAQLIDEEVRKLVQKAYARTKKLLIEHRDQLETLAEQLLEKEVILKKDLPAIFGEKETKAGATSKKNIPAKP
ncbi:MAG: hypothetical protein KDC41_25100, partial [Saprospiraceae bacterium]|nr:hypothetical protein [Saprospiraceae bacterium]